MLALLICATFGLILVFAWRFGRKLSFSLWSPLYVFVLAYLIIGNVGYLYYYFRGASAGSVYDLRQGQWQLVDGLIGFYLAVMSFVFGALAYLSGSKRFSRLRDAGPVSIVPNGFGRFAGAGQRRALFILGFALVPLVLMAGGMGLGNVLSRQVYLVYDNKMAFVVGNLLLIVSIPMLGWLTVSGGRAGKIGPPIFAVYLFFVLSLSSRLFVLLPLLYVAGLAFGGAKRVSIVFLLSVWSLALPLLIQLPLEIRGMQYQGFLHLADNLRLINVQPASYMDALDELVTNVTFGVPLAGYVANTAPIRWTYLVTSVQPLPSFINLPGVPSWGDISDSLRYSHFVPYNAIGELMNHGKHWVVLYFSGVGFFSAYVDVNARFLKEHRSKWGFLAASLLIGFFAFVSTQYNLRSSTRLVMYALLIAVVWRFVSRVRTRY